MPVIIHGATVIRCDNQTGMTHDSAVAIDGDRIIDVGDSAAMLGRYSGFERIDGTGKAIMPGLINSHTHLVLTAMRGTIEDYSGEVIYGYMGPITFAMTPQERSAMARLGCLEAIRSGTTTVSDSSRFVGTYADAVIGSGLRVVFSELAADAVNLDMADGKYRYERDWGEQYLERTNELIDRYHKSENGRVECQVAAHAPDNCSEWMLRQLLDIAQKHGLRRNIHLAQSLAELQQVQRMSGKTSVNYLLDNGWLDSDLTGAHWTYCDEADIAILAKQGVHMAHCPANSSRRGPHGVKAGYAYDSGVNIALGTDNMTEDMFRAMQFGIVIHRGSHGGGTNPSPQTILDCATRNGATALGRLADLGSIEAGKKADLTMVDFNHARMRPINNALSNLVHYADPGVVDSVIVDGRFVMQGGKVLTLDESEVLAEAEIATTRAWERLLAGNGKLTSLRT